MASTIYAKNYTFTFDGTTVGKMLMDGIPDPSPEAETVDDTTNDSGDYYEFFLGRVKSGNVKLKCLYDPDDAGQTALIAAYAADLVAGATPHTCILTLPGGVGTKSYLAYVGSCTTPTVDKKVGIEFNLVITGAATWATTASALTTPFFACDSSTTVFPVASATGGTYVINFANGTAHTHITPTATAGVIRVNGTVVATGVASAQINLTEGGIVTAKVTIKETGKAYTVYTLLLCRAAAT